MLFTPEVTNLVPVSVQGQTSKGTIVQLVLNKAAEVKDLSGVQN